MTTLRAVKRPATYADAQTAYAEIKEAADEARYLLQIRGSLINEGIGRDIDILALPLEREVSPAPILDALRKHGWVRIRSAASEGFTGYLFERNGLSLDLHVHWQ